MSITVTTKLLEDWGATCDVKWFDKMFPGGLTGNMSELVKTKGIASDHMRWFTQQAAIHLDTPDGEYAYRWIMDNADLSWLATTCIHMKNRSPVEGIAKIMASQDILQQKRIADSGLAIQ